MELRTGEQYLATVTSNDPALPIPAGTLVAVSSNPAIAQVGMPDAGNVVAVRAIGPGTFSITYSCPGFAPATETGTVRALPALVVADGEVTQPIPQ